MALRNERGGLIAYVLIMSVVFSIGALSVLLSAMAEVKAARAQRWRTQARYLAEAEMIRLKTRLFDDPSNKAPIGSVRVIDGRTFDATASISTCTAGPNCADKILVRVVY